TLRDMIKGRMSTAEISDIHIENATDPVKPFVYSFHIRAPEYAQRTGKRLFLQPAFLQRGISSLFSASDRKYPIYFHYSWIENDMISIKLPAGFVLDHADAPAPFAVSDVVKYDVKISVVGGNEELIFKRMFAFNGLIFPITSYTGLKK